MLKQFLGVLWWFPIDIVPSDYLSTTASLMTMPNVHSVMGIVVGADNARVY